MARRVALGLGGVSAAAGVIAVLSAQVAPATVGAATAAAVVAAPTPPALPAQVSSFALAPTSVDMVRVAQYWSPERLREASSYVPSNKPAKPGGLTTSSATPSAAPPVPGSTTPSPSAAEAVRAPSPRSGAQAPASPPAPPPMVGKVFFKVGDKEYWCSGSVVHSKYKNLVATAAHCAYALSEGKPVEDWIFIPSYADGRTDSGIFVGHTLYLHEDFAEGDFDRDYAFVTVHRGFTWRPSPAGQAAKYLQVDAGRLEDKVGAFTFAWNKGTGRKIEAFGYPAGAHPDGTRPYTGQQVVSCSGVTEKRAVSAPTWQLSRGVRLPDCPFTSGASGGPWVAAYDPVKRTGYINGVISLTWNLNADGRLDALSTPYFNAMTHRVYTQAAQQFTG